jgi:hypothetical protein
MRLARALLGQQPQIPLINRWDESQQMFLMAGGQLIGAVIERTGDPTLTRYFHSDHLGSIAAITSEAATIVERLAAACPRVGAAEPGERLGQAPLRHRPG